MPKEIVGADRAIVTATPLGGKANSSTARERHVERLINNASMGEMKYGRLSAPLLAANRGNSNPLPQPSRIIPNRIITEEYRGETFKLSRENYNEIREGGVVRRKEFNGKFVDFSNNPAYGGNQRWFRSPRMQDTGCGPIAATNIIFYYAQTGRLLGTLVGRPPHSYDEDFTGYATKMYSEYTPQTIQIPFTRDGYDTPVSFGIWFMNTLVNGVVNFARRDGVTLSRHTINNSGLTRYDRAVDFIKAGLQDDNPVALLVTYNDYIASGAAEMVQAHFVTITAMTEIRGIEIWLDSDGNEIKRTDLGVVDYELRTSDWGQRRFIPSLKQMWNSTSLIVAAAQSLKFVRAIAGATGFASVSLAYFNITRVPLTHHGHTLA